MTAFALQRSNVTRLRSGFVRALLPTVLLALLLPFPCDSLHDNALSAAEPPGADVQIRFQEQPGSLRIFAGDRPLATYVYKDPKIPRPYFAHVKTLDGIQVTRNHPPVEGQDATDHATMHPGIWLAFGDLDGADFWRNKARIAHDKFLQKPRGGKGQGSFVEQKRYVRPDNSVVCHEQFRCSIQLLKDGYLLVWDSTFRSEQPFAFGDQEEMGLGIRVASELAEKQGGSLSDSEGRRGAQAIWSQAARWCDYSGTLEGRRLGMTLLCHPENFRPSWMHARNYGFVAANAFGRKAMQKGETSKVVVQPGKALRLRYAIWIHSGKVGSRPDAKQVYADYAGSD